MLENPFRLNRGPDPEPQKGGASSERNDTNKELLPVPEGWENANSLVKRLNTTHRQITNIAAKFSDNKNYFGIFINKYSKKESSGREYYSPELVHIIEKEVQEIKKIKAAPEGWENANSLVKKLNTSYHIISKICEKYRTTLVEDFSIFKSKSKVRTEYFSPRLVALIKKEIQETKDAPEGWKTRGALAKELEIDPESIDTIVSQYRTNDYSRYFEQYKIPKGQTFEHYSPELVAITKKEILKKKEIPKAPEGWKTNSALAKELQLDTDNLAKEAEKYTTTNPEYFFKYKDKPGNIREHYSPELINILKNTIFKNVPEAPEGWKTNTALFNEMGVSQSTITNLVDKYRSDYKNEIANYKDIIGNVREHYSPELSKIIKNEYQNTKEAPEGWKTNREIADALSVSPQKVANLADRYRESNPDYFFQYRKPKGPIYEHYSPILVEVIKNEINKIPKAPAGWETNNSLAKKLGVDPGTTANIAANYKEINSQYFQEYRHKAGQSEHFSPELVKIITEKIKSFKETLEAPIGWRLKTSLSTELGVQPEVIVRIAEKYQKEQIDSIKQFKDQAGRISEYYSPELVTLIKEEIQKHRSERASSNENKNLEDELVNLLENLTNTETRDNLEEKIFDLVRLLPGNAHDIILKYHPRYKGLRADYVKQVIADYLGDFMLPKNEWQPGDIQKLKEVIDIEGIQEEILINLKNGCLTFINNERRNNPEVSELTLVEAYFEKEEMIELAGSGIKEVGSALNELREYYDAIFRLRDKKPSNIIDTLREGRTFPDINQLVNIREIIENKKMLIADEMGLGKSASAILTKEYLGLSCALVVVPSNVENTWKNYLSDGVNEQGKKIGYFKEGLAPKVLVIESMSDLKRLKNESFDYVLVSQEKISGEQYSKALEQVDFDMMVVDEIHKLKNIESGVRSQSVETLANKISGENKYLALLSGTPIPNKVKDIAITLKLLYPEKYKDFSSKEMVKRILYGDLIDLRSELLKRMQMKELATSIEMPKLTEEDVIVELAPEEREIYEILLEEDELTALDKILVFRQFLLNPEILKVEPGFVGSKIQKLGETLRQDLETQNKIVVFVNGYVEGVIKGDNNIIQKLDLPSGTIVEVIHGDVSQAERIRIQNELKVGNKKTVIFVSGQTADVGVDFSGADGMIEYNDPWSKYEKKQQQGRVYREGLKNDLTVKTLVTKNSIEEGIRAYTTAKERAIEKLLKGIGNTEAEKKLLYNDSKLVNTDIETNAQLSKEYLSDWEKLMLHFGEGYESGEKRFRQELIRSGKEYADLYKKLGRLTYQGNNARVSATLIERMVAEREESLENLRILDIASGPEMLKQAASEEIKNQILSTDINIEHFSSSTDPEKTISASYLNLPVGDGSLDYANLGFAFHQTSPTKYHKKNYERLQVLAEINRSLKPGGRAVISMLHNVQFANIEKFEALVGELGFKIVPEYTGEAKGKESYKAGIFTLEKITGIPEYNSDAIKFDSADNAKYITALGDKLGREFLQGLEMQKTLKGKSRLRDQRRMIDKITLGGQEIEIVLNEKDRALLTEEVKSIKDGEGLKSEYGGIQNIPIEKIKEIGFERKLETPGYYLLYKIIKDGGAVIIRGDYKSKTKKEVVAG